MDVWNNLNLGTLDIGAIGASSIVRGEEPNMQSSFRRKKKPPVSF